MWKKGFITFIMIPLLVFLAGCGSTPPGGTVQYETTQADAAHTKEPVRTPQENGQVEDLDQINQEPAQEQSSESKPQENPTGKSPEKPAESKLKENTEEPNHDAKQESEQGSSSGGSLPVKKESEKDSAGITAKESSKVTANGSAKGAPKVVVQTPKSPPPVSKPPAVTVSIKGDEEKEMILPPTEVKIEEGDTVLTVLQRVTKAKNIHLEFSGQGAFAYVKGIDHLYEFDRGPMSGWMYRVNGKIINQSAGAVPVHPGDMIEWLYTVNLGKDLGGK